MDRLHLHHHRLPADALPAGEPADRALGPAARPGGRRRPERLRGQQRRAALVGRRDRRGRHRAGDRRPDLHPDLRHLSSSTTGSARVAATRSRSRTRRPTSGATWSSGVRRRHDHGRHRRPRPGYLRISVLNRFSDNEWSSGDRDLPAPSSARDGELPPTSGPDRQRADRRRSTTTSQITDDFISTWLPTQAPISRIEPRATGATTSRRMDFMAFDDDLDTAGMTYTMTAVVPDYDASRLADAPGRPTGLTGAQFTELPTDLPAIVREHGDRGDRRRADPVPEGRGAPAVLPPRGRFDYTTDGAAGNGSDTLEAFLDPDTDGCLTGYCEQFAAAMAVMARSLDIPARVAIGFLKPEQVGPDTWVYSAHDLHAWPELYFPGAGWVRFEPTPPAARRDHTRLHAARVRPSVDKSDLPSSGATTDDITSPEIADPTDAEPPGPDRRVRRRLPVAAGACRRGGARSGRPGRAALAAPAASAGDAASGGSARAREPVWIELRDTVVDLASPGRRAAHRARPARHLVHYFGAPPGTDTPARPAPRCRTRPRGGARPRRIVPRSSSSATPGHGDEQAGDPRGRRRDRDRRAPGRRDARAPRRRAEWLPRSHLWRRASAPPGRRPRGRRPRGDDLHAASCGHVRPSASGAVSRRRSQDLIPRRRESLHDLVGTSAARRAALRSRRCPRGGGASAPPCGP